MSQHVPTNKHLSSNQTSGNTVDDMPRAMSHHIPKTPRIVERNTSSLSESNLDSGSRIELLERSLRYIQEQHNTVLIDLHDEVNQLQQENRDLKYRLTKVDPSFSNELKDKNVPKSPSASSSNKNPDNPAHLKQRISELENKLHDYEQDIKQLEHVIDELNRVLSIKSEASNTNNAKVTIKTDGDESQNLYTMTYEKEQQLIHEILKLRTVLVEIVNTEKLNVASKILIRDCLSTTSLSEHIMSKATTTPIDMLFLNENQQQRSLASSSDGRSLTRYELPVRRLNLMPPKIYDHKLSDQHLPIEQRITLPPIVTIHSAAFVKDTTSMNSLSHQTSSSKTDSQKQSLIKFTQTSVARRERRTQELQKNRLMKTIFH